MHILGCTIRISSHLWISCLPSVYVTFIFFFYHSKYEAAMTAVTQFEGRDLKKHTLLQVGRAYLDHLLFEQKFDDAGQLCLKILGEL